MSLLKSVYTLLPTMPVVDIPKKVVMAALGREYSKYNPDKRDANDFFQNPLFQAFQLLCQR